MIQTKIHPDHEMKLPQQLPPQPSHFSFLQSEEEKTLTTLSQLMKWHLLPRLLPKLFDEKLDYYKQVGYSESTALIANIFLRNVIEMDKEPEDRQPFLETVNRSLKASLFSNYMLTVSSPVFSYAVSAGSFFTFSATSFGIEFALLYYPLMLSTGALALATSALAFATVAITGGLAASAINQVIASTGIFNAVFDSIDFVTRTTLPKEPVVQNPPPEIDEPAKKFA